MGRYVREFAGKRLEIAPLTILESGMKALIVLE